MRPLSAVNFLITCFLCTVLLSISWSLFHRRCVYLLAELSSLQTESQAIAKLLPVLAKSTSHHQYTSHVHYLETVCKEVSFTLVIHGSQTITHYGQKVDWKQNTCIAGCPTFVWSFDSRLIICDCLIIIWFSDPPMVVCYSDILLFWPPFWLF